MKSRKAIVIYWRGPFASWKQLLVLSRVGFIYRVGPIGFYFIWLAKY